MATSSVLAAMIAVLAAYGTAARTTGAATGEPTSSSQLQRGQYITHHVAMCVQCHTPRDAAGNLDGTQLFKGAPMLVASPFRTQLWATQAPSIAGTGGLNDAEQMSLLTTGKRIDGRMPLPPMPAYRLTREDAAAVIAYLRSLGSTPD